MNIHIHTYIWISLQRVLTLTCAVLQHTATHCITLQHAATHCNTLQRTCEFGLEIFGGSPDFDMYSEFVDAHFLIYRDFSGASTRRKKNSFRRRDGQIEGCAP